MGIFGKSAMELFISEPLENMDYGQVLKALSYHFNGNSKNELNEMIEKAVSELDLELTEESKLEVGKRLVDIHRRERIEQFEEEERIEREEYLREKGRMRARGQY